MRRTALTTLSDSILLEQIEKIRRHEHLSGIEILTHLSEIERRRLHLKLGYSSLFDYCVKHLRYSSSGAGRRVAVARCVARHPEVLEMLRSHSLTMTGASLIASILRSDNKSNILKSVHNRTQSEIEAIASCYRPPIALRDRVKPVTIRVAAPRKPTGSASSVPAAENTPEAACERKRDSQNGSGFTARGASGERRASAATPTASLARRFHIQFLADEAFMKKYEEARALLSHRLPDTSFANVFAALIDEFVDRHCPKRRAARRQKRERSSSPRRGLARPTATNVGDSTRADVNTTAPRQHAGAQLSKRSRYIRSKVRREVVERDGGCCAYIGRNGRRCGSTHAVQIDHIRPFARGGSNAPSNLRLLCAQHNRLVAEEVYGRDFIDRARQRV